jgi:hypothetical protein
MPQDMVKVYPVCGHPWAHRYHQRWCKASVPGALSLEFLLLCRRRRNRSAATRENTTNPLIMAPDGVDGRGPFALGLEGDGVVDGFALGVELGGGAGMGEGKTRNGPGAQDQP